VNFDISIIGLIAGCVFFRPDRGSAVPNGEDLAKQIQIYDKYISTMRSYIERYRSFNKDLLTEVRAAIVMNYKIVLPRFCSCSHLFGNSVLNSK